MKQKPTAHLFIVAVFLLSTKTTRCVYYENEVELNPVIQEQYDFIGQPEQQAQNQPFQFELPRRFQPQPPRVYDPQTELNPETYDSPFILITSTRRHFLPTQPALLANQHHNIFLENENSNQNTKPTPPQTISSINSIINSNVFSNKTLLRPNQTRDSRVKAFKNSNSLSRFVPVQRKPAQISSSTSLKNSSTDLNDNSKKSASNETRYGQIDSIIKEINQSYTIDLNRKYKSEHRINCLNCSQITYAEECKDFADYDFNELINIFCCQCNNEM
jgi:hypothetical protein